MRATVVGSSSCASSEGGLVSLLLLSVEWCVFQCRYRKLLLPEWEQLANDHGASLRRGPRHERLCQH